jgi:polyisoprenoid-binding protein YceI
MIRTLSKALLLFLFIILLTACAGAPKADSVAVVPTKAPTVAPVAAKKSDAAPATGLRTFVIVPAQSKASYHVDEEFFAGALAKLGINAGKAKVTGSTQAIDGQLQLNLADLTAALGDNNFAVQMNTLVTNQAPRDKWIRENGPNFNAHPVASFKATAIQGAPTAYSDGTEVSFKLVGDLTIREQTKPATFDVKAKLAGDTLTGVAMTQLLMSDFGIEPPNFANTLTVADAFAIEVQFTAKEK